MVGELADFNFTIRYLPGKIDVDADTLSRMPLDINMLMETCTEETTPGTLKAVISSAQLEDQGQAPWLTALTDDSSLLDLDYKLSRLSELPQVLPNDIQQAQSQDPMIGTLVKIIQSGQCTTR